ncbi:hypothetical protein SteCoe_4458 [Stentor coeruleus]|uniref:Uncharacterized protein n=1 Tax=Stentor coeruleus TaxID=5963 RepID=A0A1R2CUN9_9CILI|nr:hypothetical protein SteCoe_4458 [Stentor coeruleus]
MDMKRKEEILKEIDKEENLCNEIYEGILKNRIKYEEEIRLLQQEKLSLSLENMKSQTLSRPSIKTVERGVSPIRIVTNKENIQISKCSIASNSPRNQMPLKKSYKGHNETRIPLQHLQVDYNFDGLSSRKNPLDSLRSTSGHDDFMINFDSLQYSKDLSSL